MKYLFGPVPSRRLGYSLGIDILPAKVCTFDCIYCEVGKTTRKISEREDFGNSEEILAELKEFLEKFTGRIDHITVSGSGEPTLHKKLGYLAEEIKKITEIPLALITNASLFHMEDVRKEAMLFDVVLPSIDAGLNDTFQKVNQPHRDIVLEDMIDGLKKFCDEYKGKVLLEILFVKGINDSERDILALRKIISVMKVSKLQINTVVRPPAYEGYRPIEEKDKEKIRNLLGDIAEIELVFKSEKDNFSNAGIEDVERLIARRPCTFETISASLGIPIDRLRFIMDELEERKIIKTDQFNGEFFYSILNKEKSKEGKK